MNGKTKGRWSAWHRLIRRAPAACAFAALASAPAVVCAQDTEGTPPAPEEEAPTPLPKKADLHPAIPPEFNRPVPDYHVVRDGDTLFDLSRQYFGNEYLWPIIWAFNPHVTNPHWIYPGDVVYLRAPLPGDAPYDDNRPEPFAAAGDRGISVALAGFWTERATNKTGQTSTTDGEGGTATYELQTVGQIEYSPANKRMLAYPDKVYIGLNDDEDSKVKEGSVYAVLRVVGDVEDPEDDDIIIARKFKVIGAVRVVEANPDYLHSAVIVQSWEEMERGDYLYPYERQLLRVAPAVASNTATGNILDTVAVKSMFAEHDYVLINRGDKDGVRVGNRFFVYDRKDGLSLLDEDDIERLPFERIGQMIVIHTEEEFSTCLVTDSRYEFERGMRVEMYEGF